MAKTMNVSEKYGQDGVVAGIRVIGEADAASHRVELEAIEADVGSLHYVNKIHTVMGSALDLAQRREALDVVEALIGPNILLYSTTYIIKEPGAEAYVAWHQDLTYWGLADDDAQVSMWLAIAPAPIESGCMRMIPGSHRSGRRDHVEAPGDGNVLLLGQQIDGIDAEMGQSYPLAAGEASFHHGWTVHTSAPNTTNDRRIGLNVQYIAPHNDQAGDDMTATLVRGTDRFGYYQAERLPSAGFERDRWIELQAADAKMRQSYQTKD